MKTIIILAMLLCGGCAYNNIEIVAIDSAVYCTGAVDKPVSVSTPITAKDNTVPLM